MSGGRVSTRVARLEGERDRAARAEFTEAVSRLVDRTAAEWHVSRRYVVAITLAALGLEAPPADRASEWDLSLLTTEELRVLDRLGRKATGARDDADDGGVP